MYTISRPQPSRRTRSMSPSRSTANPRADSSRLLGSLPFTCPDDRHFTQAVSMQASPLSNSVNEMRFSRRVF